MIYREPDFLWVVLFGSSSIPTCLRERGRGGARSYDRQKAWSSINHSMLSPSDEDLDPKPHSQKPWLLKEFLLIITYNFNPITLGNFQGIL
jgi:hypothetical protein